MITNKEGESACNKLLYAKEWSFLPVFGNEKAVIRHAAEAIRAQLCPARLEDVQTVLAEACINAIEYGDGNSPVIVRLNGYSNKIEFDVINTSEKRIMLPPAITAAEIWKQESPRGWGLLFIRQLTDQFYFGQCCEGFYVRMTYNVEGETV